MTPGTQLDNSWMWHPSFSEERKDTAGLFVHFRRTISFDAHSPPPTSLKLHVTADTRYKLYVNGSLVSYGPVKGDANLWFYDEVDVGPHLRPGNNTIAVIVLRFFYATKYATSFPRLPAGGLRVVPAERDCPVAELFSSGPSWETAIDEQTVLRIDEPEDDFLHVYEHVSRNGERQGSVWTWFRAEVNAVRTSTGNSPPWNLSPRMIPQMEGKQVFFRSLRNLKSSLSMSEWSAFFVGGNVSTLRLPSGSTHQVDLEAPEHVTAFLKIQFQRPLSSGGRVVLTYSESYEDEPRLVPYLRSKRHRLDDTKGLYGPKDIYEFQGPLSHDAPVYDGAGTDNETIAPYHWRTFRFIRFNVHVGSHELVLQSFDVQTATYPLNVKATVDTPSDDVSNQLWSTSLRTLTNCMHDCYEDCPLYEQLQYAMDTRSSILFTYYCSGDDRLARQAITQIYNSFHPAHGLTCSRAPSHKRQIIPPFSLYWILTLCDHLHHFNDGDFIKQFLPVADAVLAYFGNRVDAGLGLIVCDLSAGVWNFVDWAEEWRPYGIPPAAAKSGISTYVNLLYAYTLKSVASVVFRLGRPSIAEEYLTRSNDSIQAVLSHCFDGSFFTDSLTSGADKKADYSQHSQVWAVLSGAVGQNQGRELLRRSLEPQSGFTPASISMAFYTLRALSSVGGSVYDDTFHQFWAPWREQLALGVTTWEEDSVSQRSDCHAWGSAPIYEFMAEVAGVKPLQAGWSAISIRPRISLYPSFSATVPIQASRGSISGTVGVAWETEDSTGVVAVSLKFRFDKATVVPVHVELPGEPLHLVDSTGVVTFHVQRQEV